MTPNEYIKLANATKSTPVIAGLSDRDRDILHAVIGLSTESGELLDVWKKALFYGKVPDMDNLFEEFGDILWYVAIYCYATGNSFEKLMDANIRKLQSRYPHKFSSENALNRNLDAEKKALLNG